MNGRPTVTVRSTAENAAESAAVEIARRARRAVADHGGFSLALSGGSTPWRMLGHLARLDVPWAATTIYQVDERVVPAGDPRRNLSGIRRALPRGSTARIVPMPVEASDLHTACEEYAAALPDRLDLVHLGLGADGHTASLVPGDPVLQARAGVALTGAYQGSRRMTLTFATIGRAAAVLWLVAGADKREALGRLLARDPAIPAARVNNPDQVLCCDAAAAGRPG
jgi:6-phosphogluconolactonase